MTEEREPDHIFDDSPINEYLWEFIRETDITEGDEVKVTTQTTEWQSKMAITAVKKEGVELRFESAQGTEYELVTYSSNHPLEHPLPMVRGPDWESKGVLERLEIFTAPDEEA